MTVEPGWYYAEGDPPNTLRRWNGEQWIGFPIENPETAETRTQLVGVKPFKPIAGQVSIEGLSHVAKVCLALMAAAHGYLAYIVFRNSTYDPIAAFDTLEPPPTPIVTAFTVVAVMGVITGIAFIAWFATAYRNLSKWHKTRREPGWATIVFFTPFIQFRWPWDMMLELVERSARPERQGEISPFAVLGWWSMWTFHQTLFMASMGLRQFTDFGASSYQFGMAGSACAIIGITFGIYLVHQITAAQEGRRRPNAAERELMLQNQAA